MTEARAGVLLGAAATLRKCLTRTIAFSLSSISRSIQAVHHFARRFIRSCDNNGVFISEKIQKHDISLFIAQGPNVAVSCDEIFK